MQQHNGTPDINAGQGNRLLWLAVALISALAAYVLVRNYAPDLGVFSGASGPYSAEERVMHTAAHIVVIPGGGMKVSVKEAAQGAFDAMRRVERLMNAHDPGSDIGKLNSAPAGRMVAVDPLTWTVMLEALRFNRLTDGAFDVTIGPLKNLYSFQDREIRSMPAAGDIDAALARVGSDKIVYERENMRLGLRVSNMRVDLGAIAKGFAVDQAMQALMDAGVKNAMVEIGGEVRLMGRVPLDHPNSTQQIGTDPDSGRSEQGKLDAEDSATKSPANPAAKPVVPASRPWRTGIRNPRDPFAMIETLKITDCAIATSGDYEQYFEFKGRRYSHIINPRTGMPVQGGVVSATVIHADSCMRADALATSFSVMGLEKTREFLKLHGKDLGVRTVILCLLQPDGSVREVRLTAGE